MTSVGVRELRDHLSKHLAEVQDGHPVTITDHGKPIAKIVPIGPSTFDRLIAEGKITPPKRPKRPARRPIKANGSVSELLDEQRR
jgi:prevent-host-death family protein